MAGQDSRNRDSQSENLFKAYGEDWAKRLHGGFLTHATFKFAFDGTKRERAVTIRPANIARYEREEDEEVIEAWLKARGFWAITGGTDADADSKFWKALDALADAATDRREWVDLLGEEFDRVAPLLRSSGVLATSIACPTPGAAGCPRRVVRHDDGTIRAICGDSPKVCDDLDLRREDIALLELNGVALARRVAEAFGLSNTSLLKSST